ncbi:MAG: hypothetical protein KatS3mg050_1661 [Litorilinea sp.]|nr:MAG: hypothetical protein KatS3mg050_1661 [Litorilinea sp.]
MVAVLDSSVHRQFSVGPGIALAGGRSQQRPYLVLKGAAYGL